MFPYICIIVYLVYFTDSIPQKHTPSTIALLLRFTPYLISALVLAIFKNQTPKSLF